MASLVEDITSFYVSLDVVFSLVKCSANSVADFVAKSTTKCGSDRFRADFF